MVLIYWLFSHVSQMRYIYIYTYIYMQCMRLFLLFRFLIVNSIWAIKIIKYAYLFKNNCKTVKQSTTRRKKGKTFAFVKDLVLRKAIVTIQFLNFNLNRFSNVLEVTTKYSSTWMVITAWIYTFIRMNYLIIWENEVYNIVHAVFDSTTSNLFLCIILFSFVLNKN